MLYFLRIIDQAIEPYEIQHAVTFLSYFNLIFANFISKYLFHFLFYLRQINLHYFSSNLITNKNLDFIVILIYFSF